MEYGPDFDKALQVLVGYFISRLEKFLPVPNFKQVWECQSFHNVAVFSHVKFHTVNQIPQFISTAVLF